MKVEVASDAADSKAHLAGALVDRYRCRKELFDFKVIGELGEEPGYFHFGVDITGYGRASKSGRPSKREDGFDDLSKRVELAGGRVRLPFDPAEVIENLRRERYSSEFSRVQQMLRRMYYLVRPVVTPSLRKLIQQLYARNWRKRTFPQWPVDTSVENLCDRLMALAMQAKGVERIPFIWFWPNGARGCVTMTHDVETAAGRDFCWDLMDMDEAAGLRASFQIVPEERYEVSRELLAAMRERGFEIMIQDLNHDGRLFDSRIEFLRRAKIINGYGRKYGARGFRAAMLYRKPEWLDALEFDFDMSIPNVAHLDPQRGGCCTVTPYFIGNILELPVTTTQDYMLYYLLQERSIDLWKRQTELILGRHGLVSFIIHPDYLIELEVRDLYLKLLQYLQAPRKREELWFALPSEIDRWWRARNEMSIVKAGNSYQIEGQGAERAALAFARIVDGRLVYELCRGGAC